MKKQILPSHIWDIIWAMITVSLIIIAASCSIGNVINSIDLTSRQIYTFEGVQWECSFSAVGEMEGCHQVDDPDIGFGRIP